MAWLLFIIFLLGIWVQLTFLADVSFFSVSLNVFLALILAVAVVDHKPKMLWSVFASVLWIDVLSGRFFGALALPLWLVFFVIRWLSVYWIKKNNLPAKISLVAIGAGIFEISRTGLVVLAGIFHQAPDFYFSWPLFCRQLSVGVLLNGVLALCMIWFLNLIFYGETGEFK